MFPRVSPRALAAAEEQVCSGVSVQVIALYLSAYPYPSRLVMRWNLTVGIWILACQGSGAAWHKATRLRIVILLSLSSPNANPRQSHCFAWSADAYSQVRDWRAAIWSKLNAIPALYCADSCLTALENEKWSTSCLAITDREL